MHCRLWRSLFVISLALVLTPRAAADNTPWPVPRGPARTAPPARYDPAAEKDLPAGFLDFAVCYLYSGTTHRLEPDGTVEATTYELIRLNNRQGVEQLGEYRSIRFVPIHETITLHETRVHKARGGAEAVGPQHVRLRDVNTDHQIYDPSKQVVISFPGLEVGDVLEVHWTTRGKHPEHQGQLFYRYSFGNDKYPVARDEYSVRLPKDRTLRHAAVNGELAHQASAEGGEQVHRWTAANLPAQPQGDHLPPEDERFLQVVCSTFASWDEVYRWERNLIADRSACTPEIAAVVEATTRGLTDSRDKAKALAQWVRRHVRYVSAGEKHDFTPHPPARVVAQRYGDCKDTAHLLVIMLRAAGLNAGLVSLNARGDGQVIESVPSPLTSHAIAVVTLDGRDHWIDTTAGLIAWDLLPLDDRDRVCYVTDERGIRLTRTPAPTADENRTEQTVRLRVGTDGSLSADRAVTYRGLAAWPKREEFAGIPHGEQRRLMAGELADDFNRVKLHTLTFEALDDPDQPLTARTTFTVPEHFQGDKSREGSLSDHTLWSHFLSVPANPERVAAIDLGEPFVSVCRHIVELPPALRFDGMPADQRVESPWGSFRLDVNHSPSVPHRLELVFQTRLSRTRVEPSEFDAFRSFQQAVLAGHAAPLKLKPSTVLADAAPMEAVLALAPGDATTATTLARVYLANGRAADARRVLERTRRFAPDERQVWECSLPAAADLDEEEELYREMADRFPNVWSYKLDLAHNLLDQEKPGEARKVLEPLTRHADGAVSVPALVALARCCLDQAEPRAALRHLKAARDAHPDRFDAEAWLIQGEAHEAMGRPGEALAAYRTALEKEPDAADLLEAVVRVTVATGKRDEALGYLRRFVAAVGDDAEGLARAADGYARIGRFEDASELASRAKAPDGSMPDLAHIPLGLALAHRGEFAPALKHLSIVPPDADVLAARIRCRLALGDVTEAVEDAERERAVDDSTPELRRLVSDVRSVEKRLQDLRPAASGPGRAWERFVCAEYLHSRNEWPGRVSELLAEALAGDNRSGPALALRAVLHMEGGRLTRALADAEQAIARSPQEYRGYLARGRVRYERGSAGALADLEKAAELSRGQDATVLHTLAAALAQAGRKADALAAQRTAVQLAPNNSEFRQQLQELETKK